MGTRARIGRINPSGSITSIYTHWDGYPSHHLPILTQYYATAYRVAALCRSCGAEYAYLWDGTQWTSYEVVDQPLPHLVLLSTAQLQQETMQ